MNGTRGALAYSFVEKYALVLLALAGAMILSRLLTPDEIGVVSVGAVLLGIVHVLRDFGVGQYVVQARRLDRRRLRAVLGVSFLFAWPLAALVAALGWPLARFYGEPRLAPVLQLLALNFVLIPFTAITLPVLRRQLRLGAICAINLAHGVCNFGVAVALAWGGYGFLSLALASVAASVGALCVSLLLRPRELPWLPARAGMRRVIAFGAYATGGTLIDEAGVAAPDLIIGKVIGMDGVGVFSKAVGVLSVFQQAVTSAVSPVVFPLFAAQARDGGDASAAYLRTVSYMTAFAWPFYGFVALMALPLVRLLYGDQWDAAAPLVQVMCLSSALHSLSSMARYLLVATGGVKAQARIDALAVPVRIVLLLAAAPFGLAALAWAVVAGTVYRGALILRGVARHNRIACRRQAGAGWRSAVLAALTSLAPACALLAMAPSAGQLAAAAGGASLLWLAGLVLLGHPLRDELTLARRKLAAAFPH
ncbi:MAG: oligosaccharide flippase family protein [Pseudomonadota bacterium]